jgi:2-polyprenyl-6-methoxyphenol hydroxylase-like FAD-dependent oxidoreductase
VTHDILVLGAGPSGSVLARRLASAGARVALVGGASRPGWEGLSRRSHALLADEGEQLPAGVISGPLRRSGAWAGGRPVEGTEWLVERQRLAEALRANALSAGADYRSDTVTGLVKDGGIWRARLRNGGTLAAALVIEARGRRGAERRGPLLLAVGQQFHVPRAGAPGTQIQATNAGWCWWAVRERALWVQVVARPRAGHPAAWLAAAAAQIPALARVLDAAVADGAPVARPAHARLGPAGRDPTRWRVGDAALALDPLSGQGVYEALRGARLVATAIESVLGGGDAPLAHRFVAERQAQAWATGVRRAGGFYRENAACSAFWADTAAAYEALLPEAARVTAGIERRPVLCDGRITLREVVVTAEHPRGVWHVAGVPLVSLKGYLESAEHATVAGAAAALDRPPTAVASAIHWLQQTGMVARRPAGVPSGG